MTQRAFSSSIGRLLVDCGLRPKFGAAHRKVVYFPSFLITWITQIRILTKSKVKEMPTLGHTTALQLKCQKEPCLF